MQATEVVILDSSLTGGLKAGISLPFNTFETLASNTAYSNVCYNEEEINDTGVIIEVNFDNELSMVCRLKLHRDGQFGIQDFVGQLMVHLDDRMIDPEEEEDEPPEEDDFHLGGAEEPEEEEDERSRADYDNASSSQSKSRSRSSTIRGRRGRKTQGEANEQA